MPNWELMERECISYFLCAFDPEEGRKKAESVFRRVLSQTYQPGAINDFLADRLEVLHSRLVEEFNARFDAGHPVRFAIDDTAGLGIWIRGNATKAHRKLLKFQNSLHALSAEEFESLAAIILRKLGCNEVFATPSSHDQGIDAFGYQRIAEETPYGVIHHLTWCAQAKHYLSTRVSTNDVREMVGSKELLLAQAFSTIDARYKELVLRHFAPIAIALMTTEEVPSTVRRLAQNAGVFVYASSDLFSILSPSLKMLSAAQIRKLIAVEFETIRTLT